VPVEGAPNPAFAAQGKASGGRYKGMNTIIAKNRFGCVHFIIIL
jgi:hypothetical protein